jgi:hypothetical protein
MPINQIYLNGALVETQDIRTAVEAQKENIEIIKAKTSDAIKNAGLDTFTQQNAALGIYEPARCEAIKNYIAACRNEYLRCKALILAATTNDEADAVQFIAPPVPEGL